MKKSKSKALGRSGFAEAEIHLTAEESKAFAEALLSPREPTDRLKAAAKRYKELFDS